MEKKITKPDTRTAYYEGDYCLGICEWQDMFEGDYYCEFYNTKLAIKDLWKKTEKVCRCEECIEENK